MKKSYISPSTEVILLHTENVGAMTISFQPGEGGGEKMPPMPKMDNSY